MYRCERKPLPGFPQIAVVSAGTTDRPVIEEARVTLELFGNSVEIIQDVGVAGIHRTIAAQELIDPCPVVIVVAGMEGALPSVIAGLISKPVTAVPTSIGYGASFGGIAALLGILKQLRQWSDGREHRSRLRSRVRCLIDQPRNRHAVFRPVDSEVLVRTGAATRVESLAGLSAQLRPYNIASDSRNTSV